ncbi:hypothetical protein ACLUEY_14650 [Vreelandella aquamarina]
MRQPPTLYWVIGSSTDAGKTAISSALVRYLAKREAVAGFKPYGGIKLLDSYDFLLSAPGGNEQVLFGKDAVVLSEASNMTTTADLELVAPSYRISYPHRGNTLLMRKGALALGNRAFYSCMQDEKVLQRRDIQAAVQRLNFPMAQATALPHRYTPEHLDAMDKQVIQAAYQQLCERGAASIVCEGSGCLLPVWSDTVRCHHLILIGQGKLHVCRNLNVNVSGSNSMNSVPSVSRMINYLQKRPKAIQTVDHIVCGPEDRQSTYDTLFKQLGF